MSLIIGLTGPIGCGKSTIAAHLASVGGHVIDADDLARQVTDQAEPRRAIEARFGPDVTAEDGGLDRAALADIVFADPAALRDLEAIVHPQVHALIEAALMSVAAQQAAFVAIEAIKLVEAGLAARCDEVWLIVCDRPTQRARLTDRGLAPADAERRLEQQGDLAARLAPVATRILRTDGELAEVLDAVDAALEDALSAPGADGAGAV